MLVEDDKKLAGYLTKGLKEEQYVVDVFHDGISAWESAGRHSYDLVILDVMLPGRDGMTLCRDLRNMGSNTPIIMLTARAEIEDRIEGLNVGADDYITKPFSFEELLARVRALLRRASDYRNSVLKAADLELDPAAHKVTRGGKGIRLTGKEYALLEYLLRNKGRILTETNILEHVWGENLEPFTNVVSVYIHYLRNKVDRNFDVKLIQTVRSLGYMVEDDEKK